MDYCNPNRTGVHVFFMYKSIAILFTLETQLVFSGHQCIFLILSWIKLLGINIFIIFIVSKQCMDYVWIIAMYCFFYHFYIPKIALLLLGERENQGNFYQFLHSTSGYFFPLEI